MQPDRESHRGNQDDEGSSGAAKLQRLDRSHERIIRCVRADPVREIMQSFGDLDRIAQGEAGCDADHGLRGDEQGEPVLHPEQAAIEVRVRMFGIDRIDFAGGADVLPGEQDGGEGSEAGDPDEPVCDLPVQQDGPADLVELLDERENAARSDADQDRRQVKDPARVVQPSWRCVMHKLVETTKLHFILPQRYVQAPDGCQPARKSSGGFRRCARLIKSRKISSSAFRYARM